MWNIILPTLLFLTSVFLILLVLIQRGRGGGLAGAFGGMGGQSAFGTKAGDLFTRVTIGVAAFWIILCAASVKLLNDPGTSLLNPGMGAGAKSAAEELDAAAAAGAAKDAESAAPAADTKGSEPTADEASETTPAAEEPAAVTPAAESPAAATDTPEKSE